jgi:hypothetical protein
MPKTFYTEYEIEDLAKRGVLSLVVDDNVVLTDLAREKALKLGFELLRSEPPSAPERPYIAKFTSPSATVQPTVTAQPERPATTPKLAEDDLYQKVYAAALAQLGNTVDPKLLETIIRRVLNTVSPK